ncbi:tetratricopeptide repeat protein [Reinekea thalattae]|nr:tetratricopeptide repeat protein [Reinekea thalattae]
MPITYFRRSCSLLLACTVLYGCAGLSSQQSTGANKESEQALINSEQLTGQNLFQLLLAEIATNRRELGVAAELYGQIGEDYNDVEALQRSVLLNQAIENYQQTYSAAKKWAQLRPNDATALSALALSATATGQVEEGASALEQLLSDNKKADVQFLLSALTSINSAQRQQFSQLLADVQQQYPKNASLYYLRARLAFEQPTTSLELTESSIAIESSLEAELYKLDLLQLLKRFDDAKLQIQQLRKKHPKNNQVAVLYARYLYQYQPNNIDALAELHTQFSTEPIISRTYARSAFNLGEFDTARAIYAHLLSIGALDDEAFYFLGRIDLANNHIESAADNFQQVQYPPYLLPAIAEWVQLAIVEDETRIMANIEQAKLQDPENAADYWGFAASYYQNTGKLALAKQTLTQGLAEYPNSVPLLYSKAMLAAAEDNNEQMEEILLQVLAIEPDNVDALNSLGYTWANLSKNLTVAHDYINRALAHNIENPAFQDSKGWILYRLGELEESLVWLQKAYAQYQNDEVAAHVAEVQWQLKQFTEAKQTLEQIKTNYPDSDYIDYLSNLFEASAP